MNVIAWLLRLLFFLAVLWLALKNTMPVNLRLTENLHWEGVPLVLVMLGCLLVGMLLGALALAPRLYRLHRRAAALDSGAADMAASGLSARLSASSSYWYSSPYLEVRQQIVYRSGSARPRSRQDAHAAAGWHHTAPPRCRSRRRGRAS